MAFLEVHVVLLSLVDLDGSPGEELRYLGQVLLVTLADALHGHHQHVVSAQDGRVVVPLLVDGGLSASHLGTIHQVIMEQCEIVVCLQSNGGKYGGRDVLPIEVAGHEEQDRAYALPSQREGVGDRGIESFGYLACIVVSQSLVDDSEQFVGIIHYIIY